MARKGSPPPRQAARPAPRAQPTLGQATGGRPGRVLAAAQPASPRPPAIKQGLGLGLGLNPRQRGAFTQAAQQGQGSQFIGNRPWLANRIQNRVQPGSGQEQRIQNFLATGQSQRPQRPTPQPPGAPQPWNESVGQTP